MAEREIKVNIGANTKGLDSGLKRATGNLKRFAVTAAAALSLKAMTVEISQFETSMSRVSAISKASAKDLEALRKVAKDLGKTTEFSASQAADGLGFFAMAGFSAKEAMAALPATLDLATASGMGLAQAADIASNVLSGFGKAANEAGTVADVLAAASSAANTDVYQLGSAMSTVAPISAALGISLEDTAAAIGVMSDAGIQGERAGTALRGVLSSLAGPTKQAVDALANYGLTAKDVNPETNSLADVMARLKGAGLGTADAMKIFGREAASGALVLINSNDRLREFGAELENVGGAAGNMAKIMRDNLGGDINGLVSSISGLILSLGDAGLTEVMRGVVQAATYLVRGISDIIDSSQTLAMAVEFLGANLDVAANSIGVLAVGLTVKAIPAIYSMVTATGFLTGAMVALRSAIFLTGIGALVIGAGYLITKFADLTEKTGGVGNALGLLKDVGLEVFDRLRRGVSLVGEGFAAAGMAMKAAFFEAFAAISQRFAAFTKMIADGLNAVLGTQLQGVGSAFADRLSSSAADLSTASAEFGKSIATSFGDLATPLTSLDALTSAMNAPGMTTGATLTSGEGGLLPPALSESGTGGGGGGVDVPGGGGGGKKGGAGAGIAEQLATRLEALQEGLMTESEVVAEWYEQSRVTLAEALEAELLTRTEYNDAIERLEAEHQDRLGSIKEAGNKRGLQAALSGGAQILGAMGAMNKKALKASQIFAAAEALISTYKGAAKELEKGVLGYATAAAVIAKGIGFVAAIKGVSASGGSVGGGGGGGGGSAAPAPAPAQAPATTFAFTLQNDPMGFGESFARQLIDQLNATQRNGGQIRGVLA